MERVERKRTYSCTSRPLHPRSTIVRSISAGPAKTAKLLTISGCACSSGRDIGIHEKFDKASWLGYCRLTQNGNLIEHDTPANPRWRRLASSSKPSARTYGRAVQRR